MIPVAFLASVILFVLLKLTPGDPVLIMLGERATAQNYEALPHDLGLDQPYPVQYVAWVSHVAQGDFGKSLRNGSPVQNGNTGEYQALGLGWSGSVDPDGNLYPLFYSGVGFNFAKYAVEVTRRRF